MLEWFLPAVVSGGVAGLIAWGGLWVELRYMRRDIDAAHRRLDKIKAPAAWTRHAD